MKRHKALMLTLLIGFSTIFMQLAIVNWHLGNVSESLKIVKDAFIYE